MANGESKKLIRDYGSAVLLSVAVALVIRGFLIEAYRIPSPVMRPTLEPGDTIFVLKAPYRFGTPTPSRGEVVVYAPSGEEKREYIKRVIGLPGDAIESRKGVVQVDGQGPAGGPEAKLACGPETSGGVTYQICREPPLLEDFGPQKVPAGHVLVMGDLRSEAPERGADRSAAARRRRPWEIVPIAAIRGRALWIWLSIDPMSSDSWFSRIRFERMFRRIK